MTEDEMNAAVEATLEKIKRGEGRFIDHEAMERWLESWGTDHELPPPEPKRL